MKIASFLYVGPKLMVPKSLCGMANQNESISCIVLVPKSIIIITDTENNWCYENLTCNISTKKRAIIGIEINLS